MQHGIDGYLDGYLDADLEAVTNNRRLSGYEAEFHHFAEVPRDRYGRTFEEAHDDDRRLYAAAHEGRGSEEGRSFRRGAGSEGFEARRGAGSRFEARDGRRHRASEDRRVTPQELAEICERLALERDQAVEEAKEARSARDSALAACAQLASIAPDRRAERDENLVREREALLAENEHLKGLCAKLQGAGQELVVQRNAAARAQAEAEEAAARLAAREEEAREEAGHVRRAADAMLSDAAEHIQYLAARCRRLEGAVEALLREQRGGRGAPTEAAPAPEPTPAFGMTHTRAAIEAAVRGGGGGPRAPQAPAALPHPLPLAPRPS